MMLYKYARDDIISILPRFIAQDRNGRALAKAIGSMLEAFNAAVNRGIAERFDIETMSEAALDEKAWALGMSWYDFRADVETKRLWIREADAMRRSIGTIAAVTMLMQSRYKNCVVEEWPQYNGEPYHFRVMVFGSADDATERWARAAIAEVKSLRSVLDGFYYSQAPGELVLESIPTSYDVPYKRAGDEIDLRA